MTDLTTAKGTKPAPPVQPTPLVQFVENAFAAVRTAGALLVGNSALMFFEVIGTHREAWWRVLIAGVFLFIVCSYPAAVIARNAAVKALKSQQP